MGLQSARDGVARGRAWWRSGAALVAVSGFGGGTLTTATVLAAPSPAGAAPASCVPAGATGLTAAVVATSGQTLTSSIDATGCDVGIYIGPGVTGVTISGATVNHANDHGILAEDTSGLTVTGSTVSDNGVARHSTIDTDKAIMLVGVSGSTVTGNTVTGNTADGGISVADESPTLDPAALTPTKSLPGPVASTGDVISNNVISGNYGGCGIVIESWVAAAGVHNITVSGNRITGAPGQFGPHGPVIGQIVVATDAPGATLSGIDVKGNTVTGSFLSGITVHANAPGDSITGTTISGNTLAGNNWGLANGAPTTDAIALEVNDIPPPAPPLTLSGTTITGNTMSEATGVFQTWQVTGTTLSANNFSGRRLLYTQPAPGTGYWMAASDGGVFAFGRAGFYGSMGGQRLAAPVVGMAQTRDQGGYLLFGADGGVFSFGDSTFYGSVPATGHAATAAVVGGALAPVVNGPPGTPGTNGLGYWLVGSDGNVYGFGRDAKVFGTLQGVKLAAPIAGMATSADGLGYWLVGADGGVFGFGDARFHGSLGGIKLASPIVAIAKTPSGNGYWLAGADGGVFAFGDARFHGSAFGKATAPIRSIASSPDGGGYTLTGADGAVYTFGDARPSGSLSGVKLNAPVVSATNVGVLP